MIHSSDSIEQTEQIASQLAQILKGGECIALFGELGAGKTQFVRGLAKALGNDHRSVSSPTFVLLNVYDKGRLKIFHLDAYRATGAAEFEDIGFVEMLEQGGVVVVEWAERILPLLPERRIEAKFAVSGPNSRTIEIFEP